MNFAPGSNLIRILPPTGQAWDYPHFRLVPKEVADRVSVKHDGERWKSCPMCAHEAVQGIVDFLSWVQK